MASIQYNVGTWKGLLGTANVYEAKSSSTAKVLIYKALQPDNTTEKWMFMPRSAANGEYVRGNLVLAAARKLEDYEEIAPTGLLDANGFVIVDNDTTPTLPRLFVNQGLFSLKGNGVAAYDGTDLTSRTGPDAAASTVVINSTSKTVSEMLSEGVTWVTKNPLILIAIAFIGLELFGVTHFLGLNKKKKTLARRRR
jgi:hypothetical protein